MAHRWAGLSIALFLVVAGGTGVLLPWNTELTRLSALPLSLARPPDPYARPLDAVTLADRVRTQTGAIVTDLTFDDDPHPRYVASLFVQAPAGGRAYDTVWADPYTGVVRSTFRDGELADGPQAIMSFLYRLHRNLALGSVGQYALGIAALVWTLDCFVGFYLTLPPPRTQTPAGGVSRGPGWWRRWGFAWRVRWRSAAHKLTFDLHRAGGLWLWPLLFVFAWSSVAFNLPQVSNPVMRAFGGSDSYYPPTIAKPLPSPSVDFAEAVGRGREILTVIGRRRGFEVGRSLALRYMPDRAAYRYSVTGDSALLVDGGRRSVYFSAMDGRFLGYEPPMPKGGANRFMRWLDVLHTANVLGLPYRVFESAMGALTVLLSVTGILIWTKKRSARLLKRAKYRPAHAAKL